MGNPNRDDRIYGVYSETSIANHIVPALPASCILPVSVSQPAVVADNSIPASGEDLAVTFLLPSEYHGVVIKPDPGRKLLSLKAAFMDPSFEPVTSSDPPRATLAKWWKAVSKRVRVSFDKKQMPDELKDAMRGRARLYLAPVGEALNVVDLAVEAPTVDPASGASDGVHRRLNGRAGLFPGPALLPRVRPHPARTDPALVQAGVCYPGLPGLVRRRAGRIPPPRILLVLAARYRPRRWSFLSRFYFVCWRSCK